MHIDNASRQYVNGRGEQRTTTCYLLRRSYRDENGKPRNETLANLSDFPENAIAALRLALKGATLVDAESAFSWKGPSRTGMWPRRTSWPGNSGCGHCSARRPRTGISPAR
jgi:hypothetical protein